MAKAKKVSNWWRSSTRITTPEFRKNREQVRLRDQGLCVRCWYLYQRITQGHEVDHFIPQVDGGDDSMTNLMLLCSPCHAEKTQRESHGYRGWKPAIGLDGWELEEPDWLVVIAEIQREWEDSRLTSNPLKTLTIISSHSCGITH